MKKESKDLTEKAVKKELRGYYYAGVHQYEGECDEDNFVDIVCCDQYGVSYESCYDGWDYIIREVPEYEDVCGMESEIQRLKEQLNEANEILKSLTPIDRWQDDAIVLDYLEKWGVK